MKASFKEIWSSPAESPSNISVNEEELTGLRVVFVDVPGPLCSITVIVPTEAKDDSGLPHCLEHLVFLGSQKHQRRGFLDTLASRCLTPGTNAATSEDKTEFTVCCAGQIGLLHLLPAFLDHILHPTLLKNTLLTEIYNVGMEDEEGGVVFCEMLGRENGESDLCEIAVRKLAYSGNSSANGHTSNEGYAANTGGRTDCIAKLTHEQIKLFHAEFYQPSKITVLIQGQTDHAAVFDAIQSILIPSDIKTSSSANNSNAWNHLLPSIAFGENASTIVPFPVDEEEEEDGDAANVGSVVIAWRGPQISDLKECIALEILCRKLEESAASPLRQRFVERDNPLASDADLSILPFKETLIELTFTGVSNNSNNNKGNGRKRKRNLGEKSETKEASLLSKGAIKNLVLSLFQEMKTRGTIDDVVNNNSMDRVVERHYLKLLEDLEDEPHDTITELLNPDIVFSVPIGQFGSRLNSGSVIKELIGKPDSFWIGILDKWLISNPCIEVIMKPDASLSEKIAEDCKERRRKALEELGEIGIKTLSEALRKAKEEQQRSLPKEILETLPPIPPTSSIPTIPVSCNLVHDDENRFTVQLLRLNTMFAQTRLCFDLSGIPSKLKPYLILFQELFLTSPLKSAENGGEEIPFTEVAKQLTQDFVSIEGGVGFGQGAFSCECLSDVFTVWAVSETNKFQIGCKWLSDLLHRIIFTPERIETVATNLLSDVVEFSRDGAGVCEAVSCLLTSNEKELPNDVHIGVLVQRRILEHAVKNPYIAVQSLSSIRDYLLGISSSSSSPNSFLIQFCVPNSFPDPISIFKEKWLLTSTTTTSRHEKKDDKAMKCFALPYKRQQVVCNGRCLLVPINGVETSFVQQIVKCDIPKKHEDFFPVLVLCEILSRTEGPLYTKIRGAGLAYDASINFCFFNGLICFNLHETSSPEKALLTFKSILEDLPKDSEDNLVTTFLIETARSSLLYYFHSDRATVPSVSSSALKGIFKGFATAQEEHEYQLNLDKVDKSSIFRVFNRYFSQFLRSENRVTVITTGNSMTNKLSSAISKNLSLGLRPEIVKLQSLSSSIDLQFLQQLLPQPSKTKKSHKTPHRKSKK